MQFHHIGIATDRIDRLTKMYTRLLGVEVVHEEELESLRVIFLDLGDGYIELLEPINGEGPIARYLDRHGSGIHHMALATDDIVGALERARGLGITTIDDEPRAGAWGHEVAFLHPSDTGGVLVEFVSTHT